jgi:hypothetical protein
MRALAQQMVNHVWTVERREERLGTVPVSVVTTLVVLTVKLLVLAAMGWMVNPVKTMGHPQERQSVVVNVLKDTLVPIVRLRTHVLLERTDNLVRTVAPSLGQQAIVRVLVQLDILVPIVRLHHHVQKDLMVKIVKTLELQMVSLDHADVLALLATKVITAKRHLHVT